MLSFKKLSFLICTLLFVVVLLLAEGFTVVSAQQGSILSGSSIGALFDAPKPVYLKHLGMKKPPKGALVIKVFKGSPADKSGMQSGDLIKSVNGQKIKRCREFLSSLNKAASGTSFHFLAQRGGKKLEFTVIKALNSSIENSDFKAYSQVKQSLSNMTIYNPNAAKVDHSASKETLLSLIGKAKEEGEFLFSVRLNSLLRRIK